MVTRQIYAFAAAALASAATYQGQPITIDGTTAVAVTGINNAGTIIGTFAPGQDEFAGFIQNGNALTVLNESMPSAINQAGAVVGIGNTGMGFLWQNGSFVAAGIPTLGTFNNMHLTPVLNRAGEIAYSVGSQNSAAAYAGHPNNFHALRGVSTTTAIVSSINAHGVVAGYERATINGQQQIAIFFGKSGAFDVVTSNSGQELTGGFLNNAGALAYSDGTHGYVYQTGSGTTATFAPSSAQNLQVQAINNNGRVVGTYTDTGSTPAVQRVFIASGSAVATFGSFGSGDFVQVSLNDHGVIAVADSVFDGVPTASYLVHCVGHGC